MFCNSQMVSPVFHVSLFLSSFFFPVHSTLDS